MDLEKRLTREDFRKLYEFASTNRDLQNELLTVVENRIPSARTNGMQAYYDSVNKANEIVEIYNSNVMKIAEILERL